MPGTIDGDHGRGVTFLRLMTGATLLGFIFAFAALSNVQAATGTDSYSTSVFQLLKAHRDGLPDLIAPAEATAAALVKGGSLYLGGDKAWIAEGDGRAGGLMAARPLFLSAPEAKPDNKRANTPAPGTWLPAQARPVKGDVVWIAYAPASYQDDVKIAQDLRKKGCLVILFGPKPESGRPNSQYWIDSDTSPTADLNLTRMGNILSLWTLTAETTAATSRQGRTLTFYQSDSIEGAQVRNALYRGLTFHTDLPKMAPVPPGLLSKEYLDAVQKMLEAIRSTQQAKIIKVGQEMAKRAAEGQPARFMMVGHMAQNLIPEHSKLFDYLPIKTKRDAVEAELPRNGLFVMMGYVGIYGDLWRQVRAKDATAVWIVSPLPTAVNFAQWGDVIIDQEWKIGDCALEIPGYDVKVFPLSGVAQVYIYEMLLHAAAEVPSA